MVHAEEKDQPQKTETQQQSNGNACLLGGLGMGAFGTSLALGANFVCPICMIGTPLLLGIGGWQKYRYLKNNL